MYRRIMRVTFLLAGAACAASAAQPAQPEPAAVAELLEDNGEALLAKLNGGPGEGHVEKAVVFSGKSAVKIIPMQRYHRNVPGWEYKIREKPKPGEYRYLRFAWKADGCVGIMIQLHDQTDWNIRYTAGRDVENWGTRFVPGAPPSGWAVVTCDLWKDFGDRTIRGIALTAHGGRAGYFDHIYFGRTVEDLDRIDATGLRTGKKVAWADADLNRFWDELGGADAARSYLALWSLVASPEQSAGLIKRRLTAPADGANAKAIRQWIGELNHQRFAVREAASKQLAARLQEAAPLLREALRGYPPAEVRRRAEQLLASIPGGFSEREQHQRAVRVLEYVDTPQARECLKELTGARGQPELAEAARAALKRLSAAAAGR